MLKMPQVDIDCTGETPWVHLAGKTVSLEALAALTPAMIPLLEELAKPEADGQVYRVERKGDRVRLIKMGVMGHLARKAGLR